MPAWVGAPPHPGSGGHGYLLSFQDRCLLSIVGKSFLISLLHSLAPTPRERLCDGGGPGGHLGARKLSEEGAERRQRVAARLAAREPMFSMWVGTECRTNTGPASVPK